jgi:AraC-like DNA-binding protein
MKESDFVRFGQSKGSEYQRRTVGIRKTAIWLESTGVYVRFSFETDGPGLEMSSGAFGSALGERFLMEEAPTIVTRSLGKTEIVITELCGDPHQEFMSGSIPKEDAFLVGLQLKDFPAHEYWEEGRQQPTSDLKVGDSLLYDLKRDPVVRINRPFHSMHFYLPRSVLNAMADDAGVARIGELNYSPGIPVTDPTISNLGNSIRAAFEAPNQVGRLFVDHVTLAIAAHVAQAYGGMRSEKAARLRGLAQWQLKRATELLSENLDGEISLGDVAKTCELSLSHFSRAFRESTGQAPHQWLLHRRVNAAKECLRRQGLSLAEIAIACGFADQSHMTRVFTRLVGVSPGAWRRSLSE